MNETIATGHAVRCMSIAAQLRKKGIEYLFIVSDTISADFIRLNGYETTVLGVDWKSKDSEIDLLKGIIKTRQIIILLIDSYDITNRYLSELSSHVKIVYLDDYCNNTYNVSAIIHYIIGADKQRISNIYINAHTNLLIGSVYAPLRNEFSILKPKIRSKVENVLVITGGTDKLDIASLIVNYLADNQSFQEITFHIVLGKYASEVQTPIKSSKVVYHRNVTLMADLMQSCDAAISAGGTTLYELCACGIPSVSVCIADNQVTNVQQFNQYGIIPYAGDMRTDQSNSLNCISKLLLVYIHNIQVRYKHSELMRAHVDGKGAERIVDFLINLLA